MTFDALTTPTSVVVRGGVILSPFHLMAGSRPSPAPKPDSFQESTSSRKRRKRGLISTTLQPYPSSPTPAPLGPAVSHVGHGSAPHCPPNHIYRLPWKGGRCGPDQRGERLLAGSLSWARCMAHCRNLLPWMILPFQLSSPPSGSDCTCYFFSWTCHRLNKRCRHLFHNKEEDFEGCIGG